MNILSAENHPSKLLSPKQNQDVFKLLGLTGKSQATTVVRAHQTRQPNHNEWHLLCHGIATFTKYSPAHFYIEIYNLLEGTKLFAQKIDKELNYITTCSFFHQFDGEEAMIGLEFVNDEEAANFKKAVESYLQSTSRGKKNDRVQESESNAVGKLKQQAELHPQVRGGNTWTQSNNDKRFAENKAALPNFRPSHVREERPPSRPPKIMSTPTKEEMLAVIMSALNVSPEDSENPDLIHMIEAYIEENGGYKKVYKKCKKIMNANNASTTPAPAVQPAENSPLSPPPPPPPPPPPSSPPPPPSSAKPVKPTTQVSSLSKVAPTSNISSRFPPPPPKFLPQSSPSHRKTSETPSENNRPPSEGCSRNNLLMEIRNPNLTLKKVTKNDDRKNQKKSSFNEPASLFKDIVLVLEKRADALQGDSDSDEESYSDDEGW